jgi:tRNA G18 (ribose-2'-O)-methylase SpoU
LIPFLMKIKKISSRNNPTFRSLLKLLSGKGIKKQGLALMSGPKQVREVLQEFQEKCHGILFTEGMPLPAGIPAEDIRACQLVPELFRELDHFGTGSPILIISTEPLGPWDQEQWPPGCTLFVPFQDPANVGAVVRSGAALGVAQIVLLREAAHPFHPRAMRVAGSCLFRIPMTRGPSVTELQEGPVPLITLSPRGMEITRYNFPETFGLVPGMEGPGLPPNLGKLQSLSIPMEGNVESLNAAAATGIALYAWRSGRPLKTDVT